MTTEERLETLEKELAHAKCRSRRLLGQYASVWTVVCLAAGAFALVWIVAGMVNRAEAQWGGVPTVIRANAFLLEDKNGKVRARLAVVSGFPLVGKDAPSLILADENGEPRAWLSVDKDGPALTLYDQNGKTRAVLGAGQEVFLGGRTKYSESSLRLFGADGKGIWQAP